MRAPSPPCGWQGQRGGAQGGAPCPLGQETLGGSHLLLLPRTAPTLRPGSHPTAWTRLVGEAGPLTAKPGPRPGTGRGEAHSPHAQAQARTEEPLLHRAGGGGSPTFLPLGGREPWVNFKADWVLSPGHCSHGACLAGPSRGALRLVAGRPPGHVADAVLPLHLPAVCDLHLQTWGHSSASASGSRAGAPRGCHGQCLLGYRQQSLGLTWGAALVVALALRPQASRQGASVRIEKGAHSAAPSLGGDPAPCPSGPGRHPPLISLVNLTLWESVRGFCCSSILLKSKTSQTNSMTGCAL